MDGQTGDWRDGGRYAPLLGADRSFFAWEWLRRRSDYREAAAAAVREYRPDAAAAPWGLHRFEDPGLGVPLARPLWTAGSHGLVLPATARPAGPGPDSFDPGRFDKLLTRFEARGSEHLLISDGFRSIRLDIAGGTLGKGAVLLCYRPSGIVSAARSMVTLKRFLALCASGRFEGRLFGPEIRARRWVMELRAHDALCAGASHREIAEQIFALPPGIRRWRIEAPTIRLQVQRLVRRAEAMASGGYCELLDPPPPDPSCREP